MRTDIGDGCVMSNHTPGALRAAKKWIGQPEGLRLTVEEAHGMWDELAQIIDDETGLRELLEALQRIVSKFEGPRSAEEICYENLIIAKDAIAKAKGE